MTSISVQKKRIRGRRDEKIAKKRSATARRLEKKSESTKLIRALTKATGAKKK